MRVLREDVRQKVVAAVRTVTDSLTGIRVRWPGEGPIDVSEDKGPYTNIRIVYTDGYDVGLGEYADTRLLGTIVAECCYKEGDTKGMVAINDLLDKLTAKLTSNDTMFPVRTMPTKQVSPPNGPREGWQEEGLVTPFWFDTSTT